MKVLELKKGVPFQGRPFQKLLFQRSNARSKIQAPLKPAIADLELLES